MDHKAYKLILQIVNAVLLQNIRQVGRRVLEHVSGTRGLAPGLQFLCCSVSSLAAILSGLKLALKLVKSSFCLFDL